MAPLRRGFLFRPRSGLALAPLARSFRRAVAEVRGKRLVAVHQDLARFLLYDDLDIAVVDPIDHAHLERHAAIVAVLGALQYLELVFASSFAAKAAIPFCAETCLLE